MDNLLFDSPREALGYYFAHHAGPKPSTPRWTDAPRSTGRTPWAASLIGCLLYGPIEDGFMGIEMGSRIDLELRMWATTQEQPRTPAIEYREKQLRRLMRKHGVKRDRRRPPKVERHDFTDAYTGTPVSTLVESRPERLMPVLRLGTTRGKPHA